MIQANKYLGYDDEDAPYHLKPSWEELKIDLDHAKKENSEQLRNMCSEFLRRRNDENWHYEHPLDNCPATRFQHAMVQFQMQLLNDGYRISDDGFEILELKPAPSVAQLADEALLKALQPGEFPQSESVLDAVSAAVQHLRQNKYDESLMKLRSALQRCLGAIASELAARQGETLPSFKEDSQVRDYLERKGFLTREERKGFDGIYGLLSCGPHAKGDKDRALLGYAAGIMACYYAISKFRYPQNSRSD